MQKLISPLGAAIGSRYLKNKNQLVFVEWTSGYISTLDMLRQLDSTVSSGTTLLKGTWAFDCESGTQAGLNPPFDIWWEQMTAVNRQMVPLGNSLISNMGIVDFNLVTPAIMQQLNYNNTPICGNNDATNKLVNGDVFCVKTREGNYAKIKVVTYGYDMQIQWVTYKLKSAYKVIGTGYVQPEDIAVLSNEYTSYVTERGGNFLKVDLGSANKASASVIYSGLNAPHQIWIDEPHFQAYVVEFANPGRIVKIDLSTHVMTPVYSSLNLGIGLVLTSDLKYAYVSEQGTMSVSRITLATGIKTTVASGLTNPFFLSWADSSETALLIAERDPANRISRLDLSKPASFITHMLSGTGARPSSVSVVSPGNYCVCCDSEIDYYDIIPETITTGIYKGIGYVPWNCFSANGKTDFTLFPTYIYKFDNGLPFGGNLPVMIDHRRAWEAGYRYYRVLVNSVPRTDSWTDLKLNPANGKYEIPENFSTFIHGTTPGFYSVHNPLYVYYNSELGCPLNSTTCPDGQLPFRVEFYDSTYVLKEFKEHKLFLDNNHCVAVLQMPELDGNQADPVCGVLKYAIKTSSVYIKYIASHPHNFGSYTLSIIKGAGVFDSLGGPVNPALLTYSKTVNLLLKTCIIAAFSVNLNVGTSVINGIGRQSQYDASAAYAFCLAP
jgi:hypothetical protein